MIANIVMDEGKIIRVSGPANIEVTEGEILLVGAKYGKGSKIIIHRLRSYGIKALRRSRLKIITGSGGEIEEPSIDEEVIDHWLKLSQYIADKMKQLGKIKTMILGPVESGKTTLSAFISNFLLENGYRVALIDADIGQEDLAPPTFIALTYPRKPFIWQRTLLAESIRFVGCNSPQYCSARLVVALKDLVDEAMASGVDAVVINTDGWVQTPAAMDLKLTLIRWVKPNVVISLSNSLTAIIRRSLPELVDVMYAPSPKVLRERGREDRKKLRAQAYERFLKDGREVTLSFSEVKIIGSCVVAGNKIDLGELTSYVRLAPDIMSKLLYASLYENILNLVVTDRNVSRLVSPLPGYSINIIQVDDARGLVVGVLNEELKDVSIGVIKDIDYIKERIKIITPWKGEIGALIVGRVKLNENYEDTGRVGRCIV
jgi:polynucleotide 5'-hydroxyl-kinase GRC3/NOL9